MYQGQDRETPIVSISLRAGGSLDVWPDRIDADDRTYPLAELRGAALTAAPHARTGTPAIALRGRDGGWDSYMPMDPPDAQRALDAIYARRPDLRDTRHPAARSSAERYGVLSGSNNEQRVLAGIAHLSFFFAPFLLPLIIWLVTRPSSPYASHQAKQALFFHLGMAALTCFIGIVLVAIFFVTLIMGVGTANSGFALPGLLAFPIGIILVIVLFLVSCGYSIYAAINAFQGHPFAYPFLRRL